jgi:hypothetical protein
LQLKAELENRVDKIMNWKDKEETEFQSQGRSIHFQGPVAK